MTLSIVHRSILVGFCLLPTMHLAKAQSTSRLSLGAGYTYTRTNVLPGCNCVSLNGSYAQAEYVLRPRLSVIATLDAAHKSGISPDGYALTQVTYIGGLRFWLTGTHGRVRPFAEFSFGGAHASGSLAPASTAVGSSNNTFAIMPGGGLEVTLSHRFSLQPVEINYLRTGFSNTAANTQNDLRISSGLRLHLR